MLLGVLLISKLANTLRMMILIQSRGKMKCKELAEELEVSERQIKAINVLRASWYIYKFNAWDLWWL